MFTQHTAKALHLVLGAAVTGTILIGTPARAEDPVERTPSTMNQASVYESTLKFYLHPARLELGLEPPRKMMDHPAVIVARRAQAGQIGAEPTAQLASHPATVTKARQVLPVYATQVIDRSPGE